MEITVETHTSPLTVLYSDTEDPVKPGLISCSTNNSAGHQPTVGPALEVHMKGSFKNNINYFSGEIKFIISLP